MEKSRKLTARQKHRLSQRSVKKFQRKLDHEVKTGKNIPISKREYESWLKIR